MARYYPDAHRPIHSCCPTCAEAPVMDESVAELAWLSLKRWSTGLGKLLGIEVRIHLSFWLFATALLEAGFVRADYSICRVYILKTAAFLGVVLAVLGSIMLHEMAHALVAERLGKTVKGILLHPLGGLTLIDFEGNPGGRDVLIYLTGPLINLTVWAIVAPLSDSQTARLIAEINCDLGLYNLTPIFPLDGGKIFRELLIMRGYSVTAVNRIISFCSRMCCLGIGIYALRNNDFFLAAIVAMLWLLSCWVLNEEESPAASRNQRQDGTPEMPNRFLQYHRVFVLILLLILMAPREIARDGRPILTPRPERPYVTASRNPFPDNKARKEDKVPYPITKGERTISHAKLSRKPTHKAKQAISKTSLSTALKRLPAQSRK